MTAQSRRGLLALAASGLVLPALARAQGSSGSGAWTPDRPIRVIVPYNAGGLTDIMSRAVGQAMGPILGQPLVIENRPGANGSVGTLVAARAAPDGTTLTMGITDTFAINPASIPNLAYDPEKDFAPITIVSSVPLALMVGPTQRGVTNLAQLTAAAKAKQGGLSYATWGVGSSSHLAMEFVAGHQGFEKLHVPFTGQAPGMQAVVAGQVDSMILTAGGADSMAKDGRARVLAVAAPKRIELMPDVPTMQEAGVPLVTGLWLALYAPARTPRPIIDRINAAYREAARSDALLAAFRGQSAVPEPSTPEELAAFTKAEIAQWGKVVRDAKISVS